MVIERNFLGADAGIFRQNEVLMKKIPLKRIFAAAALVCCLTVTTAYADVTQEDIDNAKNQINNLKNQQKDAQDAVDDIIGDPGLALAGFVGAGGLAAECSCVDVEAGEPECGGDVLHVGRRERRFISEPYVPVVVSHAALFVELGICYSASFNEISTYVDDSLAVFGDFISGNASHAQHGTQLRRICKEYLIE